MSLKTKYNLFKIKRSLSPSTVFKASLQKDLNKAWDAKYGKVSWVQTGVMYRAGAMAVAVLVLVGSGGAYAYNSPDVTEGNIFYPVKKAIENVEEKTRITPEAKAKFLLKKIERREAERERLVKNENKVIKNQNLEIEKPESAESEDSELAKEGIKNDRALDVRLEKINKSIEDEEDRLDKFSENFRKIELEDNKLQEEVKNKIEKRLEKRRERLEKLEKKSDKIEEVKNSEEKVRPVEDRVREIKEDRSGSRDLPRLDKVEDIEERD